MEMMMMMNQTDKLLREVGVRANAIIGRQDVAAARWSYHIIAPQWWYHTWYCSKKWEGRKKGIICMSEWSGQPCERTMSHRSSIRSSLPSVYYYHKAWLLIIFRISFMISHYITSILWCILPTYVRTGPKESKNHFSRVECDDIMIIKMTLSTTSSILRCRASEKIFMIWGLE